MSNKVVISIRKKDNNNNIRRNFVSEDHYIRHNATIDFKEDLLIVDKSLFPTFFRKLYVEKEQITENVKELIPKLTDETIYLLIQVLSMNNENNMICMNDLFDWEDDANSCMRNLRQKLVDNSLQLSSYLFLYVLDEFVKGYDTFIEESKKNKLKHVDLQIHEEDLFGSHAKDWDSNSSKTIRCEALIDDDTIFCKTLQSEFEGVQRYIYLKNVKLEESKMTSPVKKTSKVISESVSPPLVTFQEHTEFMFDIYYYSPISRHHSYVDFFVILPKEETQEYYHLFFHCSESGPQVVIRKIENFVENIFNKNTQGSPIYEKILYKDEIEILKSKQDISDDVKTCFDFTVWETISENTSINEMFKFSMFLEYFLSTVELNKSDNILYTNFSSENKVLFKYSSMEESFFELEIGNTKNIVFEMYESAYLYTPMVLNRIQFIDNIMQDAQSNFVTLNLSDFKDVNTMDEPENLYSYYQTIMHEKITSIRNDLCQTLNYNRPFNKYQPSMTESRILYWGILGEYKEIQLTVLPLFHGIKVTNSTLNHYSKNNLEKLLSSIGSNHYSKINSPFDITPVDCFLMGATNQVNTQDSKATNEINKYKKSMQSYLKQYKKYSLQGFYENYINFMDVILTNFWFHPHPSKKLEIKQSVGKKKELTTDNETGPTTDNTKKKRGRPPSSNAITEREQTPFTKIQKTEKRGRGRPPKNNKDSPEKQNLDFVNF
jgi:hypothetical protein